MYCVIVGDIIHSKSLDPTKRNKSTDIMNHVLDSINSKYENDILANFGIVRGDAFEGVLFSQQTAPRIIQDIIIGLYNEDVQVRISSAIGHLSVISSERNKADGPAFHTAISRIEKLRKNDSNHWFQVSISTDSIGQPLVDGLLHIITALTKNWTPKQTGIVWSMIKCDNRQSIVCEHLNISPALVSKQLKAAQYDAYQSAWTGLERYLIDLEEQSISPNNVVPSYTTYYTMANRKTEQEDFSAAIAFYQEALELALIEFGQDSPNLVRIYNGLINAYLESIQGSSLSSQAKKEYKKTIQEYIIASFECQKTLPKNRVEYARTIALHGDFLTLLKKDDEAVDKYREAIHIMEYCDYPESGWLFECYNNLAIIYMEQGKEDQSFNALQKAIECAERNQASSPVFYAAALYHLGTLYRELEKHNEAISTLNRALEIYKKVLPAKDRRILLVRKALQELEAK